MWSTRVGTWRRAGWDSFWHGRGSFSGCMCRLMTCPLIVLIRPVAGDMFSRDSCCRRDYRRGKLSGGRSLMISVPRAEKIAIPVFRLPPLLYQECSIRWPSGCADCVPMMVGRAECCGKSDTDREFDAVNGVAQRRLYRRSRARSLSTICSDC